MTHGSWWGNIVNRKPPRGGGFLSIKVNQTKKGKKKMSWQSANHSRSHQWEYKTAPWEFQTRLLHYFFMSVCVCVCAYVYVCVLIVKANFMHWGCSSVSSYKQLISRTSFCKSFDKVRWTSKLPLLHNQIDSQFRYAFSLFLGKFHS